MNDQSNKALEKKKAREQALALERQNIMGMTPEKALEAILDHPYPVTLVQSFAEEDLYLLMHAIGPDDALPMLGLASNEQWQYLLDMEEWTRDRMDIHATTQWLDRLLKADPEQPIRNVTHSLAGGAIVSGDTPIAEIMEWIADQRIVFVLEGREVSGIVTIWDFNKQPARAYYYLVLAGLEIALADLVRWRYGRNQSNLVAHLGSRDTEDLQERIERDRQASGHGDLVSYLNFKHLLRVFEKDRALRMELGKYESNKWNSMTRPLGDLRNEVMHPVKTLVGSVDDMRALTRNLGNATSLVEKAILALRKKYPAKPK